MACSLFYYQLSLPGMPKGTSFLEVRFTSTPTVLNFGDVWNKPGMATNVQKIWEIFERLKQNRLCRLVANNLVLESWQRARITYQMLSDSDIYLLLFLSLSNSSLQIIVKAFALLKYYRLCVRWLQAAAILSLNLSAAVMEAGAGVISVSSAHFQEPPSIRSSVHTVQDILQMEEVFAEMKGRRKQWRNTLTCLRKCSILFEAPLKNFLWNNRVWFFKYYCVIRN